MHGGLYFRDRSIWFNLCRGILSLTWAVTINALAWMISLLTFSWRDKGRVTKFKIWRIRRFTDLKLWLFREHRWFCMMIDREVEFAYIDKRFGRKKRKKE